jgi:hypothetical protein
MKFLKYLKVFLSALIVAHLICAVVFLYVGWYSAATFQFLWPVAHAIVIRMSSDVENAQAELEEARAQLGKAC